MAGLALAALALLAVGCGGRNAPRAAPRADAPAPPTGCAAERARLARDPYVAGAPLRTILRVPARGPARRPLIVALHGQGQDGSLFERFTRLTPRAGAAGFAVAYPSTGNPRSAWQVPGELDAVKRTIAALTSNPCIDPSRVYATGFSAGGRMSAGLACNAAELIRAYAPVSGGIPAQRRCTPSRKLDVLAIHGTGDGVVPYRGPRDRRWRAIPTYIGAWANRDGCRPHPVARQLAKGVTRFTWQRCANGHRVALIRIVGSGHGWPPHDAASIDVDASAAVVRFFAG